MEDTTESLIIEEEEVVTKDPNRNFAYARNLAIIARKGFLAYGRPMAYASEFGESTRPVLNKIFVNTMYGLSFAYIGIDIGIKANDVKIKYQDQPNQTERIAITLLDQSIWHGSASMLLPGLTIHSIVKYCGSGLNFATTKGLKLPGWGKYIPTAIGIGSIPFIIHPLDHVTDFVMDNTFRKFYTPEKFN